MADVQGLEMRLIGTMEGGAMNVTDLQVQSAVDSGVGDLDWA